MGIENFIGSRTKQRVSKVLIVAALSGFVAPQVAYSAQKDERNLTEEVNNFKQYLNENNPVGRDPFDTYINTLNSYDDEFFNGLKTNEKKKVLKQFDSFRNSLMEYEKADVNLKNMLKPSLYREATGFDLFLRSHK
ncbi:MAG: hypothetical protein ABIB43_05205 [archaeon]